MSPRFESRIPFLVVVLSISGLSALAGCYTVLKHPPTAAVADGGEGQRDCYSCHGPGGGALAYDPLHSPAYDYYPDTWYGFYAYPWWWRDYWQDDIYAHGPSVGSGGQPKLWDGEDESRRRLWGRGSEFLPPSLPPINGAPSIDLPRGSPATTPPPPVNHTGQQPGRTIKEGDNPPPPGSDDPNKDSRSKDGRETKGSDAKKEKDGGS